LLSPCTTTTSAAYSPREAIFSRIRSAISSASIASIVSSLTRIT